PCDLLAEQVALAQAGNALCGRVPEAHAAVAVDEEHAVADRGERARRLGALLRLAIQACVLDCRRGTARELFREPQVGDAVRAPRLARNEGDRAERMVAAGQRYAHV